MDSALKKRKPDENGTTTITATTADGHDSTTAAASGLAPEDLRRILEPFTRENLLDILQAAASRHPDVLDSVRAVADRDPAQRKLFVRGLGWDTYTEALKSVFSAYGEIHEAVAVIDKTTGKSKGYGFVTFKHIDGALLALKEPSKKIDGRMTVTTLASAGPAASAAASAAAGNPTTVASPAELSTRKIYVANVPGDMPAERLLSHFSSYGEVEEGPLGFDKQTGKSRGYALFVYKTAEAARAALVDPVKNIDGHHMTCKLANEGKWKPGAIAGQTGVPGDFAAAGAALQQQQLQSAVPNPLASQYAAAGAAGFGIPGGQGGWPFSSISRPQESYLASTLIPPFGATGLSAIGNQAPSGSSALGGYGAGAVNPYGGLGDMTAPGYAAGLGSSSLYRLPTGSGGFPSSGYPGSGHYGLSSAAFQGQLHQPSPSSNVPRVTSGSSYPTLPPRY